MQPGLKKKEANKVFSALLLSCVYKRYSTDHLHENRQSEVALIGRALASYMCTGIYQSGSVVLSDMMNTDIQPLNVLITSAVLQYATCIYF